MQKQTLDPKWGGETLTLGVDDQADDDDDGAGAAPELVLEVMDHDRVGANDLIGRVVIPLAAAPGGGGEHEANGGGGGGGAGGARSWRLLSADGVADQPRGSLEVSVSWVHSAVRHEASQRAAAARREAERASIQGELLIRCDVTRLQPEPEPEPEPEPLIRAGVPAAGTAAGGADAGASRQPARGGVGGGGGGKWGARLRNAGDVVAQQQRQRAMLAIASRAAVSATGAVALRLAEGYEQRQHEQLLLGGGAASFHAGGAVGAEISSARAVQRRFEKGGVGMAAGLGAAAGAAAGDGVGGRRGGGGGAAATGRGGGGDRERGKELLGRAYEDRRQQAGGRRARRRR
eukprot:COSAG01_NODE_8645_length_2709_cov_49.958238_2_plen_347_part_00